MGLLGVGLCGLLAAVAGSVLLARLLRDSARPWSGAVLGAVFCTADVVSGRTTFALGLATGLAALLALPRRRTTVLWAVLTALLSPVAAAFLGLAATALVLCRRPGGWPLGLAASAPVLAVALTFPTAGIQPYRADDVRYPLYAALGLLLLARAVPVVRVAAGLYGVAVVGLLATQDPFGSNITRLAVLFAAPLLVALVRTPRLLVLPLALILLDWQSGPLRADLRATDPPQTATLVRALADLRVHRVEVVPLRNHVEASEVAPAVPLARGWSRQVDAERNRLFYRDSLSPQDFRAWLAANAVDAVALAPSALTDAAGRPERDLLLAGRVPGLQEVWTDGTWTVWRVLGTRPLADGPVEVQGADRTTLHLRATGPGTSAVAVRWSPWLSVQGPACLRRDGDAVELELSGAGEVVLGSSLRPRGSCPGAKA